MNVHDVMTEVATALATIGTLTGRTYPYNANRVTPPAAVVDLPESVDYDQTYGRGADMIKLPFFVVISNINDATASTALGGYLSGSGATSVKQHVEAYAYTACDSVVVTHAEVAVMTIAASQYLGAMFDAEVFGKGA